MLAFEMFLLTDGSVVQIDDKLQEIILSLSSFNDHFDPNAAFRSTRSLISFMLEFKVSSEFILWRLPESDHPKVQISAFEVGSDNVSRLLRLQCVPFSVEIRV